MIAGGECDILPLISLLEDDLGAFDRQFDVGIVANNMVATSSEILRIYRTKYGASISRGDRPNANRSVVYRLRSELKKEI